MDSSRFNESYYMFGAESNYTNYPKRQYNKLAKEIVGILGIKK